MPFSTRSGDLSKRELPQNGKIVVTKEVLEGTGHAFGCIDLPGLEPLEEILDGEVDVHDLSGLGQKAVGYALAHDYAGRPLHETFEAVEVLDVHRAYDVDPGVEQLDHVLVALPVLAPGNVRVRDLVDEHHGRLPCEDCVDVQIFHDDAPVLLRPARNDLETIEERPGLGSPMRLDEPHDDVYASLAQRPGLLEHPECLAHARSKADVELQLAALRALDELDEVLRLRGVRPDHGRR